MIRASGNFPSVGTKCVRSTLIALDVERLAGFWKAWGYEVPSDAANALALMRDRLMEVLPASGGDAVP